MSLASELISRIQKALFDEAGTRWPEPDLLLYLTDAQRQVCLLKPSAFTKQAMIQLAPGTFQSIPSDGSLLVDVLSSHGLSGGAVTQGVTAVNPVDFSSYRPNWRSDPASADCRHYIYDDRAPERFEVYPPQPDPAGYVTIRYAATPPDISATTDELSLQPIYDMPVYYFALALCFTKSTSTQDLNKASAYQALATSLVTGRKITKQELHPLQMPERDKR